MKKIVFSTYCNSSLNFETLAIVTTRVKLTCCQYILYKSFLKMILWVSVKGAMIDDRSGSFVLSASSSLYKSFARTPARPGRRLSTIDPVLRLRMKLLLLLDRLSEACEGFIPVNYTISQISSALSNTAICFTLLWTAWATATDTPENLCVFLFLNIPYIILSVFLYICYHWFPSL